ncbi:MAG: hypothetical protein QOJ11_1402 [Frankiales bacterium]|nr:hypothetical protein [Frankiales bacterium]
MVEEHQREQPAGLRFLGGQGELAGEPDSLAGQVDPARVAGRVDEVEHPQHDGGVAGLVQAAPLQGALGPADPLRHRRLRDIEGVGNLPGGEAADGAQGQRHLRGGRELGVAAAEEQKEGVVALLGGGRPRQGVRCLLAAVTGGLTAAGVDEPSGRDRGQPRPRVARRVLGPPATPPAAPPAARPRRRRSPRPGGPGPRAPAGRGRAARPRPAVASARRSRRVSRSRGRRT